MKRSSCLLTCIGALVATHAGVSAADPFGSASPSWTESIEASKPLRLEICFGEINLPKPAEETLPDNAPVAAVTPEFLAAAKTLRIAVAPNDEGRVETSGALTAVYRLATKDRSHSLDLNFILADAGRREINTSVTLFKDQWIVFGGLTRTEVKTVKGKTSETRQNLIIAVRLVSAKS